MTSREISNLKDPGVESVAFEGIMDSRARLKV